MNRLIQKRITELQAMDNQLSAIESTIKGIDELVRKIGSRNNNYVVIGYSVDGKKSPYMDSNCIVIQLNERFEQTLLEELRCEKERLQGEIGKLEASI